MKRLEDMIRSQGRALDSEILLVDSFLNNRVDPALMAEIGAAFAGAAKALGVDTVVTVEASGIAPALTTAAALGVPLVIMKKSTSRTVKDGLLTREVFSFTKNAPYTLTLKKKFIAPGSRVLLIDDFLANGEAAGGASALIEEAGAAVAAIGAVIEKAFQPGRALLEKKGYRVISLARVSAMAPGAIEFAPADI